MTHTVKLVPRAGAFPGFKGTRVTKPKHKAALIGGKIVLPTQGRDALLNFLYAPVAPIPFSLLKGVKRKGK